MKILLLGPPWRNDSIKEFLTEKGHEVVCSGDPINLNDLKNQKIEYLISSGYGPIIKPEIVKAYPKKIINLHATYLPYGKGIGTTFFAVFEGVPTGVSIHYIEETIDTGAVLARKKVPFTDNDTLRTFHVTILKETESLFRENCDAVLSGSIKAVPQADFKVDVKYRSRVDSERYMDLLPLKWDTLLVDIQKMGAEFSLSEEFWELYEKQAVPLNNKNTF